MQEVGGSNLYVLFKDLINELYITVFFYPEDGGIRFLRKFDDCHTAPNSTPENQ
jgi:hypothetical protein